MRYALIMLLLAACHHPTAEPTTMIYNNVVDYPRVPVKRFASKENCEIQRGLVFEKPLGITQYYACEPGTPASR